MFIWVCSLTVLFGSLSFGEDELTPGEMLKMANQQLQEGAKLKRAGDHDRSSKKFTEAVDTAYVYFDMVVDTKHGGVIKLAQELRFRVIAVLIEQERLEEAAALLQNYIDTPIAAEPRLARQLLATCYYETQEYDRCVVSVGNALRYNEDPTSKAGETPKPADWEERDYSKFDVADYEQEYAPETITTLHMTLAEACYKLEKWNECIEPYEYVKDNTDNGQTKGYAIMQMINAMVAIPDFERIAQWIPELYRTPARYDIRVNIALMNVAAKLYDEGLFDDALPLYRMILPREILIEYQEEVLRNMRIQAELPPEDDMIISDSEAKLFGLEDENEVTEEEVDQDSGRVIVKPAEIVELELLIAQVKELPPYEIENKYRMAQIYYEVGRYWEAVKFLEIVYDADPESRFGEYAIHQIVKILLRELKELELAETRAFAYLKDYNKGLMPRQIAYELARYYQENDKMGAIKEMLPYVDSFVRAQDDPDLGEEPKTREYILTYDSQLYYMMGVADLVIYDFASSELGFKRVLDEFPGCEQAHNAHYWYGMSKLFQNKFKEGLELFNQYPDRYPDESWTDESIYQGGLCLFGLEDYTAASNRFTKVITTYPNPKLGASDFSSVYPEACNRRGDLYGANAEIDLAEADYRSAIAHAKKASQATYAVFQLAAIYKVKPMGEGKIGDFDGVVKLCEEYLEQWGDDGADIAKAMFWIGKSKIQQQRIDEAFADYVAAIIEYGSDVSQDGVDMMIEELVKSASLWLNEEKLVKLLEGLETAANETDSKALELRLRATMAMINETETVFGRKLLEELEDFDDVPPPVLSILCSVSIDLEDYSRSEEILDIFKEKFEESEFVRPAYELRCLAQLTAEEYEDALATIREVQGIFGVEPDMFWAQLMHAQVLLAMDNFEEAKDANLMVLGVPAWRGVPMARAIYQLGQVEEKAGMQATDPAERKKRLNEAFAYYQRVYYQYKGYADGYWAAEAYIASARCLKALGRENDVLNTYRAMIYDTYVNDLPQAEIARKYLGPAEVARIEVKMEAGSTTNFTIKAERDLPEEASTNQTATVETAEGEE